MTELEPRYKLTAWDWFWSFANVVLMAGILAVQMWPTAVMYSMLIGYFWAFKFSAHRAKYWEKRARQREWHAWALGER